MFGYTGFKHSSQLGFMETFFGICDLPLEFLNRVGWLHTCCLSFCVGFEQCLSETRLSPGQHLPRALRAFPSKMMTAGFALVFQLQPQATLPSNQSDSHARGHCSRLEEQQELLTWLVNKTEGKRAAQFTHGHLHIQNPTFVIYLSGRQYTFSLQNWDLI